MVLHNREPSENVLLELLRSLTSYLLHIQYGREIAWLEMNLMEIETCLLIHIQSWNIEMVSSSYKVVCACLIEVFVEVIIHQRNALCSLDDNEADRVVVDIGIAQFLPIYLLQEIIKEENIGESYQDCSQPNAPCWYTGKKTEKTESLTFTVAAFGT